MYHLSSVARMRALASPILNKSSNFVVWRSCTRGGTHTKELVKHSVLYTRLLSDETTSAGNENEDIQDDQKIEVERTTSLTPGQEDQRARSKARSEVSPQDTAKERAEHTKQLKNAKKLAQEVLAEEKVELNNQPDVAAVIAQFVEDRPLYGGYRYEPISFLRKEAPDAEHQFKDDEPGEERRYKPRRLIVTGKEIHALNAWALSRFLSPTGKILPRRITGLSAKKQRKLAKAIKKARHLGMLPYLSQYNEAVEHSRQLSPYLREDHFIPEMGKRIPIEDDHSEEEIDHEDVAIATQGTK